MCYHLAKNSLSSSLLSKYIKIKIEKTIILLAVLLGYENLVPHTEEGT